ncbi:MAG: HU family DNA-binding protein [Muribaculaceae bacterium]|nr:HU family DNA-binding protein [Muribaculaceae bacterium]
MNNTLTLSQLITRLAKVSNTDTNTARRFLRSFFATIEDSLINGESVTIKGIGTFVRSTDPEFGAESGVAFIPDETFAAEINAPFSIFEPVEFAGDADEADLEQTLDECIQAKDEPVAMPIVEEPQSPITEPQPTMPATEFHEQPELQQRPDEVDMPAADESHAAELSDFGAEPINLLSPEPEESEDDIEEIYEEESHSGRKWLWIGVVLLIIIGGLIGYYLAVAELDDELIELQEEEFVAEEESLVFEEVAIEEIAPDTVQVEEVSVEPEAADVVDVAEQPVVVQERRDRVTKSLAALARKYYGVDIYWVFIYQANAKKLGNPDKVPAGIEVVIPDKSSFAEATEEKTKIKARRLMAELKK